MRRRDFIKGIAVSTTWPLGARAQQADGIRHIGILLPASSTDMKFQIQVQAFEQELKKFGWLIGQNVQIETRWGRTTLTKFAKAPRNWSRSNQM